MGTATGYPHQWSNSQFRRRPRVLFVVGGPGCGKGTQCENLVRDYGFIHLSTGDLLREEEHKNGELAQNIRQTIKAGQLVSSEMMVALIQKGMHSKGGFSSSYLIDGFPRNAQNVDAFNRMLGQSVDVLGILFFDCSERCMVDRLTQRGKTSGRDDDNSETIKKRLQTFKRETLPVVLEQQRYGKAIRVNADNQKQQVYSELRMRLAERGMINGNSPIRQPELTDPTATEGCLFCLCMGDITGRPWGYPTQA